MVVDTNKENLSINKLVCEKKEMIFAEGDMIVPDSKPDILSTIDTSGNICIYKKELMENKIKIDGNVNAYIMYIAESADDNVRAINTNLDFSQIIEAPKCKPNMMLDTDIRIKSIECNVINGRKIGIKVGIEINFKVYSNEEVEVINGIINNEDIQTKQENVKVNSLVGYGNTKAYVKDTITIENTDNLAEILKVNVNMINPDIKTSYNKVLGKIELDIKIMYLTEENTINTVTSKVPIVGFVDIQNVSEENVCDTNFEIKNMVIKPNSIEEHSIYIEFEVEVSCMAYEEKELELLQDLYSPTEDLNCNQKEITTISDKRRIRETCNIKETVNVQGLEENQLLDIDCVPKITNVNKFNSRIMYEGEMALNFVIKNASEQINTTIITMPFDFSVENIENGEKLDISTALEIGMQDYVIKSGGDVAIDVDIIFDINTCKNIRLNIIDSIELEENRSEEDYSLVIYIVKQGDTLWSIAKNLKSTVQDIIGANGLEDESVIKAGDKLYVPKYVRRGINQHKEEPVMINHA